MQKYYRLTVEFLVGIIALITAYDIWAVSQGYDHTISYTIGMASRDWPVIPLVFGILGGHLFFPQELTDFVKAKVGAALAARAK